LGSCLVSVLTGFIDFSVSKLSLGLSVVSQPLVDSFHSRYEHVI
jgi:hypothetical protein